MGMPVDTFTNETYKQLVSGTEHILVGSVGPENPIFGVGQGKAETFGRPVKIHALIPLVREDVKSLEVLVVHSDPLAAQSYPGSDAT